MSTIILKLRLEGIHQTCYSMSVQVFGTDRPGSACHETGDAGERTSTDRRAHLYATDSWRLGYGDDQRARAFAGGAGEKCALAQMGPVLERAPVGDGAGGLQRQRRRLELPHA